MRPCRNSSCSGRHALTGVAALAVALAALPAAAQNVALDLGDLPPGTSVTIEFEAVIASPIAAGAETIANTASVSGGNFAAVDSNATATQVAAAPVLTLTMSDGGATASPGSTVVYALVYANVGNQDASGVVLTISVPAHAAWQMARRSQTAGRRQRMSRGRPTCRAAAGRRRLSPAAE